MKIERVIATPATVELIARLRAEHGELLFHQSGGCCDGSALMCHPATEFRVGGATCNSTKSLAASFALRPRNTLVGRMRNSLLMWCQDAVRVLAGGTEGVRFLTHSRIFSQQERGELMMNANSTSN